jgi:glycosyltransferase involved in cell wall biosynthesis
MNKTTDITVIIPTYNPDNKLVKLVEGLTEAGFGRIVVVNDGSKSQCQKYFDKVRKLGVYVINHKVNKGKGRALKTAFQYCINDDKCIGVITVDGDGQHLVKDIYACAQAMLNEDRVIIGTRDFDSHEVPFRSRFGNSLTRFVFRVLCGIRISDTQTGLRAIPKRYLRRLASYQGERYEYETNMLLMMKKDNIKWSEVMISTVYLQDNESSHFNPIKDSWKIYKIIFKHRFDLKSCDADIQKTL